MELVFERRGGRTVLAHAYAEPPFRIGRPFVIDDALYVIVVCSGPGIFGGDSVHQSVHVGRGARVIMTTQAALQVHPGWSNAGGAASARVSHAYRVDEGGELHCHCDPVIPFAASALDQRIAIDAAPRASLFWSDALMSGRVRRGEAWRFHRISHELRVRLGGSLKYLERYSIVPDARDPTARWLAHDADYFATAIAHHQRASVPAAEDIHHELARVCGVTAGVDLTEPSLLIGRIAARDGARFARARDVLRRTMLNRVFQNPALGARGDRK